MKAESILDLLNRHGIETKTENGRIYATEIGTINGEPYSEVIDVTEYKLADLLTWLGY